MASGVNIAGIGSLDRTGWVTVQDYMEGFYAHMASGVNNMYTDVSSTQAESRSCPVSMVRGTRVQYPWF